MRKSELKNIIVAIVILITGLIVTACSAAPHLSFARKIVVEYTDFEESKTVEITDSDDVMSIVDACTKGAKLGSGDCGFDVLKLIFIDGDKTVTLLPAGDGCNTMKYGDLNYDKYYLLGEGNREKLFGVLEKYGIILDYLE